EWKQDADQRVKAFNDGQEHVRKIAFSAKQSASNPVKRTRAAADNPPPAALAVGGPLFQKGSSRHNHQGNLSYRPRLQHQLGQPPKPLPSPLLTHLFKPIGLETHVYAKGIQGQVGKLAVDTWKLSATLAVPTRDSDNGAHGGEWMLGPMGIATTAFEGCRGYYFKRHRGPPFAGFSPGILRAKSGDIVVVAATCDKGLGSVCDCAIVPADLVAHVDAKARFVVRWRARDYRKFRGSPKAAFPEPDQGRAHFSPTQKMNVTYANWVAALEIAFLETRDLPAEGGGPGAGAGPRAKIAKQTARASPGRAPERQGVEQPADICDEVEDYGLRSQVRSPIADQWPRELGEFWGAAIEGPSELRAALVAALLGGTAASFGAVLALLCRAAVAERFPPIAVPLAAQPSRPLYKKTIRHWNWKWREGANQDQRQLIARAMRSRGNG
ncbi:unnamed protein product, partial [Prorocentrum cordatum]